MLKQAYGEVLDKGQPTEFIRVVGLRDENVGVKVSFSKVDANQFVYRFHTDVFPNLKGQVNPKDLADTYINFKVKYLLGENWSYKLLGHIWEWK